MPSLYIINVYSIPEQCILLTADTPFEIDKITYTHTILIKGKNDHNRLEIFPDAQKAMKHFSAYKTNEYDHTILLLAQGSVIDSKKYFKGA